MIGSIIRYGSLGGVIVGALMASTMWLQTSVAQTWGMAIGYTTMLIALSTVFVAIKRRRDIELGGVIRFLPALAMGLGISVVAGIFYALAWEIVMPLMPGDFIGEMVAQSIAQQKAQGVTGQALADFTAQMEAFRASYANPLYRLPLTFMEMFPVGVLVSIVSAGLLCNRRFLPARRVARAA